MAIALRSFFDLLPSRIDQIIAGRTLRELRIRCRRRKIARPIAQARERRRLFVDLAVISKHDAGTGIQRVVRALGLALIEEASAQWEVHFVSASRRQAYHRISWPEPDPAIEPDEITGRPGDVFLGLDFSLDTIRQHRGQLARFRRDGGSLWFLICDLLPIERPEWFSRNNVIRYKAWLEILAGVADGFLCISRQTEIELTQALGKMYGLADGFRTSVIPMGHSIRDSISASAASESFSLPLLFDTSVPFCLMVGTIEPRKGHGDIIGAFDELWREGAEHRLVLIGRRGWKVEDLSERILTHPEFGHRLMWFDDVDDLELERMYESCEGVIIASHGEGFGLPLIEALGHGKPVLARDLPIFRTHADRGVRYFPVDATSRSLSRCIQEWIIAIRAGDITVVVPSTCWRESARTVLSSFAQP